MHYYITFLLRKNMKVPFEGCLCKNIISITTVIFMVWRCSRHDMEKTSGESLGPQQHPPPSSATRLLGGRASGLYWCGWASISNGTRARVPSSRGASLHTSKLHFIFIPTLLTNLLCHMGNQHNHMNILKAYNYMWTYKLHRDSHLLSCATSFPFQQVGRRPFSRWGGGGSEKRRLLSMSWRGIMAEEGKQNREKMATRQEVMARTQVEVISVTCFNAKVRHFHEKLSVTRLWITYWCATHILVMDTFPWQSRICPLKYQLC